MKTIIIRDSLYIFKTRQWCSFSELIHDSCTRPRNENVFYEAGIAHTLGKNVIPITQSIDNIPFDLRHHRHIIYLNNGEGLRELENKLAEHLESLNR